MRQPLNWSLAIVAALAGASLGLAPALWPQKQASPPSGEQGPETVQLIASLEGPALYKAYCAVCHGVDARGGGPMAASLKTPPSDLTRIAARHGGAFPRARVERIISGEEPASAAHGTRAMPVWGPIFSQVAWDQDLGRLRIHNLAAWLEKIQRSAP